MSTDQRQTMSFFARQPNIFLFVLIVLGTTNAQLGLGKKFDDEKIDNNIARAFNDGDGKGERAEILIRSVKEKEHLPDDETSKIRRERGLDEKFMKKENDKFGKAPTEDNSAIISRGELTPRGIEDAKYSSDEFGNKVEDYSADEVVPSRRFLFSPSITNTINNLNQNTNTNMNVIHNPQEITSSLKRKTRPSYFPYRRPQSVNPYSYEFRQNYLKGISKTRRFEGMEYDLRGSGLKKMIRQSRFYNNHFIDDDYNKFSRGYNQPILTLAPDVLEQARRTISHLSPEARRFLFSPTIQNTITNLNHNTNSQEMLVSHSSEGGMERSSPQILGYMNPRSRTVEYDLRGKVNKICFTLG